MKIKSLEMKKCEIPFKTSFSHNTATRHKAQAVVVVCETDSGLKGYGEGCPREYVTGESFETAFNFFENHKDFFLEISNLQLLKNCMSELASEVDRNPSSWCAIEMALLDAMSREEQKSIEKFLGLEPLREEFQYTAVLGVSDFLTFEKQFQQYRQMGFLDFKVKVSGNLNDDQTRFALFAKEKTSGVRIRLDANNLWNSASEVMEYVPSLGVDVFAIEEPLQVGDYSGCREIFRKLNTPIILDESFIGIKQLEELSNNPESWILNIRVSKLGGVLRSLEIMERASGLDIPMIVGAQVGETSLLTRAGMLVANVFYDKVIAMEGAFGALLLAEEIVEPPIMFGREGKLSTGGGFEGAGLGLEVTNQFCLDS